MGNSSAVCVCGGEKESMSLCRKERDLKLALGEMRKSLPASENASERSVGGSIG